MSGTRYDNCWHCGRRMPLRELAAHNRREHGGAAKPSPEPSPPMTEPYTPTPLEVAMLGTEDGGLIDPNSEIPAGEMFRLASEWLADFLPQHDAALLLTVLDRDEVARELAAIDGMTMEYPLNGAINDVVRDRYLAAADRIIEHAKKQVNP